MTAPSGWYPQPDGRRRYWDGAAWTNDFLAKPGQLPSPVRTPKALRVAGALLVLSVAAAYGVPFFGFLLSILIPVIALNQRAVLWPTAPRRVVNIAAALALTGLWLPALVDFFTPFFYLRGMEVSTGWLILPLCGPEQLVTWVLPAVAAALLVGVGVVLSAARRTPWYWVAAMWLAPWVHMAVFSALPHQIIC
jgi:hypothetical protein